MPSTTRETDPAGLGQTLEAVRSRPCLLCGPGADGVSRRCAERYRSTERMLVIARGARNKLALVPVFWDGAGELGCADLDALVLLRPQALYGMDVPADEAVAAAGGRLRLADGYGDEVVKVVISAARGVIACDAAGVYPAVDGSVLWERPLP